MRRHVVLQNNDRKITQDDDTAGQVEETDDNRHNQQNKTTARNEESNSWHAVRLEIAHMLGLIKRSSYSTTKVRSMRGTNSTSHSSYFEDVGRMGCARGHKS